MPMLLWPFLRRRFDVRRIPNLRYADAKRNTLDLYHHRTRGSGRPVFIHLPGGRFSRGRKSQESLRLIHHLARSGWLCISANYRLSPAASRLDQLRDIRKIITWVHDHARPYGADPHTIVIAGGSAGAYLAAQTALTDMFHSPRSRAVTEGVQTFLGKVLTR